MTSTLSAGLNFTGFCVTGTLSKVFGYAGYGVFKAIHSYNYPPNVELEEGAPPVYPLSQCVAYVTRDLIGRSSQLLAEDNNIVGAATLGAAAGAVQGVEKGAQVVAGLVGVLFFALSATSGLAAFLCANNLYKLCRP